MITFNVRITECNEDIDIYTDVSAISISDNTIVINRVGGDKHTIREIRQIDKIDITPNY